MKHPAPLSQTYLEEKPRVVIIGAGPGGLSSAIALKRQLGFDNFTVYEKGSEVGGTWRDNIYPGCSSDVPMAFYSLSTDLYDWKESHGYQKDILEYWVYLAKKYNLYPHISFNCKVVSAEWDCAVNQYRIVTEDISTGKLKTSTAHIVISAIGVLETPRYAKIPGLELFKGDVFHSARWDSAVELKGKRVGVIGNGASATQLVPRITEDPRVQVTHFCRSPNWFLPNMRKVHSSSKRWLLRNVPFMMRLHRWSVFLRLELAYTMIFANLVPRSILTSLLSMYITYTAPKEYQNKLIPTFPPGCKRIIFDSGYLEALHRPNLELNWDGIDSIFEDGILTKTGEHVPLDVIIFATGFAADHYPLPIRGKTQTIQEYYEKEHGPKAYLGTAVPDFPNFFMVFGPNTATGHTSIIFTNEVQIDYILQVIKPILEGKVLALEVDPAATDAYNKKIHSSLDRSVFSQCVSWYRVGGEGKVTNAFPQAGITFWLWLRKPNWEHYSGVGADSWLSGEIFSQRYWRWALQISIVLGALFVGVHWFPAFKNTCMGFR
ncbi:hypothetical protein GALMADRAFT_222024 [Galerina marginata CBS 339.88]|uniref:Uncharacterized protein n=1 Tax=Galerina marginata (strain CBS 339.88) TaxID=685588 RepID=A0A067TQE8_GALM3|nr:hypothetical protein GALMADRAFT_222024 [Galerina marginata CBS 339.88]